MPRKAAPKSTPATSGKSQKKPLKTVKLTPRDSDEEPPLKRPYAGFSLSNPPVFDLIKDDDVVPSSSQGAATLRSARPVAQSQRSLVDVKGKGKETRAVVDNGDDSLWVDKYEPTSEAELAVHKRKVEDVRHWLLEAFEDGPSVKLRKYRRILALTGPAGTAKTSTLRVLSRELDFEILEWRNSMSEHGHSAFADGDPHLDEGSILDIGSLFDKFQAFLTRATTCNSIFGGRNSFQTLASGSHEPSRPQSQSSTQRSNKRQLILLEDLPNLLHQPTQERFQAALRSLCFSPSSEAPGPPIVIILSDSGLRAEQPDDDAWNGGTSGRRWDRKEVLDIRNVLGPELLTSPYVTRIRFNPIAPTLMTKALQALVTLHFRPSNAHDKARKQPTRDVIDIVVGTSNGDIRSAIMALQFACVVDLPASSSKSKGKVARKSAGGRKGTNARALLEAVTRREQSLVLFHLMGKVLYNKRKSDPPASHLSARDVAKERELDTQLVDPPALPAWLSHHDRKASRVSIETLAAESPIDSSLLGLYTHQNYTQFCVDVDQCDGVCEGLSWVDCMDGALLTNSPYAFPTLTLSTLHALPVPVPRRGQKVCKPAWFDMHRRELEASDAVGDVLGWLGRGAAVGDDDEGGACPDSVGKWTHAVVATELGGLLGALDRCVGAGPLKVGRTFPLPPRTHRLFSHLPWTAGGAAGADVLDENEEGGEEDGACEDGDMRLPGGMRDEERRRGWLEEDDIEES